MKQIAVVVSPENKGTFLDCTDDGLEDVDLSTAGGSDVAVDLTNNVDLTDKGNEVGLKGMTDDESVSNGKGGSNGLADNGSILTVGTDTTEGLETKVTKALIGATEMMGVKN